MTKKKPLYRLRWFIVAALIGTLVVAGAMADGGAAKSEGNRLAAAAGRGAKILKIAKSEEPRLVSVTHRGSANFVVYSVDASGHEIDLLVNAIGGYSGTHLVDAEEGETTAAFKIDADGSWTVIVKPLTSVRRWGGAATLTGRGDDVVALGQGSFAGLDTARFTYSGTANFIVSALGDTEELLINEIGKYSGEHLVPDGTVLLVFTAEGTWTVRKV
jgi:hypothetical protein